MKGTGLVAAASGAMLGAMLAYRVQHAKTYGIIAAEHVMTIRRPASELRTSWLERDQWWRWMRPVLDADVTATDTNTIFFHVGKTLEGSVTFLELASGRGTEVRVRVRHVVRALPTTMLSESYRGNELTGRIKEDLRRFKQLAETGEVATNEGPSAREPVTAEVTTAAKKAFNIATAMKSTMFARGIA